MTTYCCQQWVGQLYYDCIQIQTTSWCLPRSLSLPPSLCSPGEVVQVQSQGHLPTPEAHFQSPILGQILTALMSVPNKILLLAKSSRQWRLKVPASPSPLPQHTVPARWSPKPQRGRAEAGTAIVIAFFVMTCEAALVSLSRAA